MKSRSPMTMREILLVLWAQRHEILGPYVQEETLRNQSKFYIDYI